MLVVVSTDVFLNVAREEAELYKASEGLLRAIHSGKVKGVVSAIALAESKIALYERGEFAKGDKIASLMEEIAVVVPVDREIAEQSAELKFRKHIDFFDAIHVVTAVLLKGVLVTRNESLRKRVEDLVDVGTPEEIFFKLR